MIWFGIFQAADYLEQAEYNTGNPEDDLKTESLVKQLLYNSKLRSACPLPFDEAKLWQGENGPELKQEIQKQFRNIRFVTYFLCSHFIRCIWTTWILTQCNIFFISAIMDCVGCEKCRLWGKLQVLGLGTALKILFSVDGDTHLSQPVCSSFLKYSLPLLPYYDICCHTHFVLKHYPHFNFLTLNSSWSLTFPRTIHRL